MSVTTEWDNLFTIEVQTTHSTVKRILCIKVLLET